MVIKYLKNGKSKTIRNRKEITYYEAFAKQNCNNDICYHCKYNKIDRISDFTLGGFWAISEVDSKLDEKKGVSLVLANSRKSKGIISILEDYCDIEMFPLEVSIRHNPALICNVDSTKKDEIFTFMDLYGYDLTADKYFPAINRIRGFFLKYRQ